MMNIINGGAHADNSVDIQEFMILPVGAPSFSRRRCATAPRSSIRSRRCCTSASSRTAVGDEGGFAPDLPSNEAGARNHPRSDRQGRLQGRASRSASASTWRAPSSTPAASTSSNPSTASSRPTQFADYLDGSGRPSYPIVTIEDGMAEDDWDGWTMLTQRLGSDGAAGRRRSVRHQHQDPRSEGIDEENRQLDPHQGEPDRHADRDARGHRHGARRRRTPRWCRTAPAKPRTRPSPTSRWRPAPPRSRPARCRRSDRIAKYNQLLRIEAELGAEARYAGAEAFRAAAQHLVLMKLRPSRNLRRCL